MPERSASPGTSSPVAAPARRPDWAGWLGGALLAVGTLIVYRGTFTVPFLLDDYPSIAQNGTLRHLRPLGPVLSPPHEAGVGGRPLLNLSYALNYAAGGLGVAGYHAVNLAIHILAGLTLFGIVRRTLNRGGSRSAEPSQTGLPPTLLALAVSAVWAWHPVQTESVTYLSQRAESLMGLFYLLTLYCFIRGADADDLGATSPSRSIWFSLSMLACLAGVGTKEVIVTAPLLVFLYDRTFISGIFVHAWRQHRIFYGALAATWLPLAFLMTDLPRRGVGFGQGVTGWTYGLTECRVVVSYLRIAFWPTHLVFDYGNSVVAGRLSEVWLSALILAVLLVGTGWALLHRPAERERVRLRPWGSGGRALGFAGAWFFLILAPSSSLVPVVNQPMAENRLYLPLAAVAAFAVVGAYVWAGRWTLPVAALAAVGLGLASERRNRDYASGPALWAETVAAVPKNARAHGDLGYELSRIPGRLNDAIAEYEAALRLQPDYAQAHDDLANALEQIPGRLNEAIAEDEAAVRLQPDLAQAHYNLGTLLARIPGRLPEAIAQEETAVRLQPDLVQAHYNLGTMFEQTPGRLPEAIVQYKAALALKPDFAEAHENLGNALAASGRGPEALGEFETAVRLRPDYEEGHYNWANLLKKTPGRQHDAITQYEAALRLRPDHVEAHNNLGTALNAAGRTGDAIAQYEEALRLDPNYIPSRLNLAVALLRRPNGATAAAAQLEAVLQLEPGNEAARQLLAGIKASPP